MSIYLLQPSDVLFFKDGRPMEGSLSGHGSAWPLPGVVNQALHFALHHTPFSSPVHEHRQGKSGNYAQDAIRDRKFGSLKTMGPFPVRTDVHFTSPRWYFPRPLDLLEQSLNPSLLPVHDPMWPTRSSLSRPLKYAIANRLVPKKEKQAKAWIGQKAYEAYLRGEEVGHEIVQDGVNDDEVSDTEHAVGIGINQDTQTTGNDAAKGQIYSAHYLRLRETSQGSWVMGIQAEAVEGKNGDKQDLIPELLEKSGGRLLIGGQQRVCQMISCHSTAIPLPRGMSEGFRERGGKFLVKWVLLSPGIWPEIPGGTSQRGTERMPHPGGWLPNWIDGNSGLVTLRSVSSEERRRRRSLNAGNKGYRSEECSEAIHATLVAALVPKPVVVTGWAHSALNEAGQVVQGAKSTHLAVMAGSIYYFEAHSLQDAKRLSEALNWHGGSAGTEIRNRRSTLMGEKGYGLGVCGTWDYFQEGHDSTQKTG